jgi:hypothetical protein
MYSKSWLEVFQVCLYLEIYENVQYELIELSKHFISGYGIFTLDGELAAWMIQSYYGAMFSMQTKPQHRRKG